MMPRVYHAVRGCAPASAPSLTPCAIRVSDMNQLFLFAFLALAVGVASASEDWIGNTGFTDLDIFLNLLEAWVQSAFGVVETAVTNLSATLLTAATNLIPFATDFLTGALTSVDTVFLNLLQMVMDGLGAALVQVEVLITPFGSILEFLLGLFA